MLIRYRPHVFYLAKKARKELLATKLQARLPSLSSDMWLKNSFLTYRELKKIDRRSLKSTQLENADRLLVYLLLLNSKLWTFQRISELINLLGSAVRHRSSGKKRSETNADALLGRNRWLRGRAEEVRAGNPSLSVASIARILARDVTAFKKHGCKPIGPESIRRIIR